MENNIRNELTDEVLDAISEWLAESSDLKSLTLELYGNCFTIQKIKKFLMCIRTFELKQFNLSYFDFVNP